MKDGSQASVSKNQMIDCGDITETGKDWGRSGLVG